MLEKVFKACYTFIMKRKLFIITSIILAIIILVLCLYFFIKVIPDAKKQKEWEALISSYRAEKLRMYEEENSLCSDYEMDVAFLGDSLTDGYDVKNYYPQYKVTNRGIGGDTTFDLENRLQVSLFDLKPKVATILIGANNFDTMFNNYENILVSIKENLPNTKIVILSLTAMGGEYWGKNNQKATYNNVKIKMLAKKYGYYFVDLYTPLFDLSTGEIRAEYTTDGGHLTPKGYEVLTATITPVLEELL